jgi:ubiquinone/menaquinone biosynthesis C-methylase UbiE
MPATDTQTFKTRDASSYDLLTDQFDQFTERLSSPLADRMVTLASIRPDDQVLDVGTGTGVVAFRVAEKLRDGGRVIGIDLSEGMLAAANSKAERIGVAEKIEFRQMDAEKLEFPDATFDVAVSLFALLHFPDPLIALKEIYRVLKPGGRLVVAVGSSPPLFSLSGFAHRLKVLPEIVRRIRGKQLVAPGFLDSLVESHFPDSNGSEESHLASHSHDRTQSVTSLVRSAGFRMLETYWQGNQAELGTAKEFWEIQRTFSSISRKRLNDATPEKVESLRQEFFRECQAVQARGGNLAYPFAAYYVTAVRGND